MVGEGEPKRDLKQQIGGFLVESRIGRGVQRLSRSVRELLPKPQKGHEPIQELLTDLKAPLSQKAELVLWGEALDTLPDNFWQKELDRYSVKSNDPSKSVN